jgi:hypothetical protein
VAKFLATCQVSKDLPCKGRPEVSAGMPLRKDGEIRERFVCNHREDREQAQDRNDLQRGPQPITVVLAHAESPDVDIGRQRRAITHP